MEILLKIIISSNSDGVHVDQARFNGKWYHITIRGFNSLGTTINFGSVINLAIEPFHLSSSNRSLTSTHTHTPSGCEGATRCYSLKTQLDDLNQCNNKNILCQKTQKTQQSNKV